MATVMDIAKSITLVGWREEPRLNSAGVEDNVFQRAQSMVCKLCNIIWRFLGSDATYCPKA